ncbi:hypothetical protein K431DRAFT_349763 [Polychaeton citri CBS 116435]|uniref:Uncharacterized protein n=1 Tax=Polychaeton citri CBS 116435 TaxID=1314669 RepID=A0A9P4UIS3_9PEZI|nr:hypothetical protein K431DRAFT_349763 [Polychaeton citri CBS 116435]
MLSIRNFLALTAASAVGLVSAQSDAGVHFKINPIDVETQDNASPAFRMSFVISNPSLVYSGGQTSSNCTVEWDGAAPTCWSHCNGTGSYFVKVTEGTAPTAQSFSIDLQQSYIYEIGNTNRATVDIATGNATAGYVCEQPEGPTDCCVLDGVGFDVPALTYYGTSSPSDNVCYPGCTEQNPC